MSRPGPLEGVTVVSVEQAVSAPMCTRTLADFGARVIKVENPRNGDFARHYDDVVHGQAAHFVWANRGKESIALNLKDERGRDILHRLLDGADVFVSNLAPGAMDGLGFGAAGLATRHPAVFAMEIDGYGPGGPLSHKRAYDLLIQAESGICAVTGVAGDPAKPGPPVADICSGLYAALTILAVLCGRRSPGATPWTATSGTVSLFDTAAELMGYPLTWTRHTGVDQVPLGMSSPAVSPYGAFRTRDGQTVVLGTTNDGEWRRLARDVLGRPDLAEDPRYEHNADRVRLRHELDPVIADWCAGADLVDIVASADAAGIGNSRYNTPSEVVAHPHLDARDRWRPVDTPEGPITALLPPPVIEGHELPMGAVPGLGEHTDAVLAGIGLSADEIATLRLDRVVGAAEGGR